MGMNVKYVFFWFRYTSPIIEEGFQMVEEICFRWAKLKYVLISFFFHFMSKLWAFDTPLRRSLVLPYCLFQMMSNGWLIASMYCDGLAIQFVTSSPIIGVGRWI